MDYTLIITIGGVIISALISFVIASVRIGEYKNKVDTAEKDICDLKKEYKDFFSKLTECSTKIEERTTSYASTLVKKKSPISLTEKGQALLSRSMADKFVLDNKDELVEKIKSKNPNSAYDVQIFAKEIAESLQNEGRFKQFKDFVYKEGLDLEPIFLVMGIYLRDIALPLLGYTLEEVDKTAPNSK